ncbi:MAG: hypothetical protein HFI90_04565 [Clostridia bacterium]|nr:hypothetical protein [Clostridia bacterium]
MTGLETILSQIHLEAQQKADSILAQAQDEADKIVEQAKRQAEGIAEKARQKAELEAAEQEKRSNSAAQLAAKQSILQEKQALIGTVLAAAKAELLTLPEEEYFGLLRQMVQQYAQPEAGELILSAKDLARMPKSFQKEIKNVQPDLTISEQTADISGGFLLVYGGVEINCGFDALFAAEEDTMRGRAHEILFE